MVHNLRGYRDVALSISEKADTVFMYVCAGGNATEVVRLYRMCFSNRTLPNQKQILHLRWQISEIGLFCGERQDTGRLRTTRMTNLIEEILEIVDNQPERST